MGMLKQLNSEYHILWTKAFKKDYAIYPHKHLFPAILDDLKRDPFHGSNIKRLVGEWKGYYRYRKGDFRLMYFEQNWKNQWFPLLVPPRPFWPCLPPCSLQS